MPKTRAALRRNVNNISYLESSSSDEEFKLKLQEIALPTNKVPIQRAASKRSRRPKNQQATTSSRKSSIAIKTKNSKLCIIDLDESDDESKYVSDTVQAKVDNFFKSSGLISDDEDEVLNKQTTTKQETIPYKNVSISDAAKINEVVIEDDTNGINTLEDIENYCKETEIMLNNANALLEKFAGSSNENSQPNEGENRQQEKGLGECPICYDELTKKQIMSTKCGHLFCKSCMEKIVKTVKNCPTCRKAVNKKGIFPIYI